MAIWREKANKMHAWPDGREVDISYLILASQLIIFSDNSLLYSCITAGCVNKNKECFWDLFQIFLFSVLALIFPPFPSYHCLL